MMCKEQGCRGQVVRGLQVRLQVTCAYTGHEGEVLETADGPKLASNYAVAYACCRCDRLYWLETHEPVFGSNGEPAFLRRGQVIYRRPVGETVGA
jgi:hypothetical protein